MTTSANRRLRQEKLLLHYTGALERGDAATIAAVLRQAEDDAALARMIDEINAIYAAEDSVIRPAVRQPSTNDIKELPMTTMTVPSITRRIEKRRVVPLTLVATLAAFLIIGSALFSVFNRREQRTPAAVQATATVAITASPTVAPTKQPMRYYMEMLADSYFDLGDTREYHDNYSYIWFEAPNKYRVEAYETNREGLYQNRIDPLAHTIAPDASQLTLNDHKYPFQLSGITASDGDDAWVYSNGNPEPFWLDLRIYPPYYYVGGFQQVIPAMLDNFLGDLRKIYDDVHQLADDTLLGRPVYVIEGKPTQAFGSIPAEATRVVFKIDQETLVTLSLTAFDANGKKVYGQQAIKFAANPSIDPALFSFTLPDEMPVTTLPEWRAKNQRLIWAARASKADFDTYGLTADAAFTEKYLVPSEFYLDSFGRSSLQYYHKASSLFGPPALAIWTGKISEVFGNDRLMGQVEPTLLTASLGKVDIHGNPATLGLTVQFPLLHKPYTTVFPDSTDFYRLYWTVGDTMIVMTADATKLTQQDVIDVAAMLSYIPNLISSKEMNAAWQKAADLNYGYKVFRPTLFDNRVSDNVETGGYAGVPYEYRNDPDGTKAAREVYNKLIPEKPEQRDIGLIQRFRLSQGSDIVLVITQGGEWVVPTNSDPLVSSHDEEFDYYNIKGTYRVETVTTMARANAQPETMQTIITEIDGTYIVMQAPVDALSKEEMLVILPLLREVPPTPKK